MKKLVVLLVFVMCSVMSFGQFKYLLSKGTGISGTNGTEKSEKLSYSTKSEEFIEFKLCLMTNPTGKWMVTNRIKCVNNNNNGEYTFIDEDLIDINDKIIYFNDEVDFLNYISKKGYGVYSENKSSSGFYIKYVLKKK